MEATKAQKHQFRSLTLFMKYDHHRDFTSVCPGCNQSINRTGIDKLATTNDVCTCRVNGVDYDHVVDQQWHKACLVKYLTEHPDEQHDYRYLPA